MSEKRRDRDADKAMDFQPFFDELLSESDRGAALLAAAFLDNGLAALLEAFLIDDVAPKKGGQTEVEKLLHGPGAPLGTFASRARAAYCMGLISLDAFRDIELIKDIRNQFAHRLHGLSFESDAIARQCARLVGLPSQSHHSSDGPKERFTLVVAYYVFQLTLASMRAKAKHKRVSPPSPTVTSLSL